jgi:hypothetical protein
MIEGGDDRDEVESPRSPGDRRDWNDMGNWSQIVKRMLSERKKQEDRENTGCFVHKN